MLVQVFPPQEQEPSCCPHHCPQPLCLASVSLTPSRLWDKGPSWAWFSLPQFCSQEQQPQVASGATGAWKDNYHQYAIRDETLRWRGAEKQNENSWSVISFFLKIYFIEV